MKSGGQMSSQSPVVWWYREVNCEENGHLHVSASFLPSVPIDKRLGGPQSRSVYQPRPSSAYLVAVRSEFSQFPS
jgi:hypothetical protein